MDKTIQEIPMTDPEDSLCPTCYGAGFIAKLYPSGHTEVRCEECDGKGSFDEEEMESRPKSLKVLKDKINLSSSRVDSNHPIKDIIFNESQNSLRKYEELVFMHLQLLEDEFPLHCNFVYEYVADEVSSWYRLSGRKK